MTAGLAPSLLQSPTLLATDAKRIRVFRYELRKPGSHLPAAHIGACRHMQSPLQALTKPFTGGAHPARVRRTPGARGRGGRGCSGAGGGGSGAHRRAGPTAVRQGDLPGARARGARGALGRTLAGRRAIVLRDRQQPAPQRASGLLDLRIG